jgi:hypothetical protein
MNRMQEAKTPGGNHCLTAAATAVTDEIYFFTDIRTELNQLLIISDLKQIQTVLRTNRPGVTVLDQRLRSHVKGHADLFRCNAIPVEMLHFMTAITDADAPA